MDKLYILSISKNDSYKTIAIGTTYGFIVCGIENNIFKKKFYRTFRKGVGLVSVVENSNIVCFVGGGPTPYANQRVLVIWDDLQGKEIMREEQESDIRGIKITNEYLVIAMEEKIKIVNLKAKEPPLNIETFFNPKGLFAFHSQSKTLFVPGRSIGEIRVYKLGSKTSATTIHCHKHQITNFSINTSATSLVTSGAEGLIIRFWEVQSGMKMKEFQRSNNVADILSLSMNPNQTYILTYCSEGLISIFDVDGKTKTKSKLFSGIETTALSLKAERDCLSVFFVSNTSFIVMNKDGLTQHYTIQEQKSINRVKVEKSGEQFSLFSSLF
ncbi:Uncharacterized protein QTN25_001423 [Entamoeba marina]